MGNILEIIETSLAKAGYKILEINDHEILLRDGSSDIDYAVKLEEKPA